VTSAPFNPWTPLVLPGGFTPEFRPSVRDWSTSAVVTTLDVVDAQLSEDVTWKPRVKLEATVKRNSVLEARPLIDGLYLNVTLGYQLIETNESDTRDTHAWLFVRELVPIIGTGTSRLLATSAESLMIDAADDEQLFGAATFAEFFTLMRNPVRAVNRFLNGAAFATWWGSASGIVPGAHASKLIGVHKRESDLSSWAEALNAATEANGLVWYVDRLGVLRLEDALLPSSSRPLVATLTDGERGTVTDFRPTRTLEPFANDVWVNYQGGIRGRASSVGAGQRRKTHVVDRTSIGGTVALGNAAAASIHARLIRSFGETFELDAAAAYWIKAGDRVSVNLVEWPMAEYIVEAVAFRYPAGDMTLTLRPA
jgi:hypothetical protein